MLRLPRLVHVRLVDPEGSPLREPDLLIGLNLLSNRKYYYGNLVGLTDSSGVAVVTGKEIEARYRSDQTEFPMDYRLELIECDSAIEVVVLSAKEIADATSAIDGLSIPLHGLRSLYERARNAAFFPAMQRLARLAVVFAVFEVGCACLPTGAFAYSRL